MQALRMEDSSCRRQQQQQALFLLQQQHPSRRGQVLRLMLLRWAWESSSVLGSSSQEALQVVPVLVAGGPLAEESRRSSTRWGHWPTQLKR